MKTLKGWENKFCPTCRQNFGGRYKALQLQSERGKPITDIIIDAGRTAFDSCYGGTRETGRNVIERFRLNLGVRRITLHDWLQFFFGLTWLDWKRTYICRTRSCSIVDTSACSVSKYYVVDKFRKNGVCSCPIRGDSLILIDRRPEALEPAKLPVALNKIGWSPKLQVVSGSHLPLLEEQEDR